MVNSTKNVIGYIHVCQKGNWQLPFDMIIEALKKNGLYDRTSEIRVGIVNDSHNIINDERLNDPKIKIVVFANSQLYERPTLSHMRLTANVDTDNTLYWYTHTKGLKHFGTQYEVGVIDWIKLMLYWNIIQWNIAIEILNYYDTYGCNGYNGKQHYSGNFWWATVKHLRELPYEIPSYYIGPEDYICIKNDKMYCIYSTGHEGGGHYSVEYPEHIYKLPDDFDIDAYKVSNSELNNYDYNSAIKHYLNNGKNENRNYKMPDGFDFEYYSNKYNLNHYTNGEIVLHWYKTGLQNNYEYKDKDIPEDFNYSFYRNYYSDLKNYTDKQLIKHWLNYGRNENRKYKDDKDDIKKYNMPEDFNFNFYRSSYNDISNYDNSQIASHWHNYGKNENRKYKDDKDDIKKYSMPKDFNFDFYRNTYNDLKDYNNSELCLHWNNYGKNENRKYKDNADDNADYINTDDVNVDDIAKYKNDIAKYKNDIAKYNLPDDFSFIFYRENNSDLNNFTNSELASHWHNFGKNENRKYNNEKDDIKRYNMPDDFDFDSYKENNNDLNNFTNYELATHWHNFGKKERRNYKKNN